MASLRERVKGFLSATRKQLFAFFVIDAIALYWLLFQARLICLASNTGATRCYPLLAAASPIDIPAWAAVLLILIVSGILYLLVQTAISLAGRFHIQTR